MVTRLYGTATNASLNVGSGVNANGLGSVWEGRIGTITTKDLLTTKTNTWTVGGIAGSVGTGSNPNDYWWYSGITANLPNGKLIDGTISGVYICRENTSFNTNAFPQCGIYVVDASGALLHTLLGAQTTGGVEFNFASPNNRMWPRNNAGSGVSLSPYTTVDATSRIVIEVGIRVESTRTGDTVNLWMGDNSGTDVTLGDGTDSTTTRIPWWEFSADIYTPPAGGGARVQAPVAMSGYHERTDSGLFVPDGYSSRRSFAGVDLP